VDRMEEEPDLLPRDPLAGSGLIGVRLGIPGLRSFPVDRTPYVLFYLAGSRRVDLVRLLHGRRDIRAELIEVYPGWGRGRHPLASLEAAFITRGINSPWCATSVSSTALLPHRAPPMLPTRTGE
jgi:hypothetical protein